MAMAMRQARRQLQFSGFEMGLIAVSFVVTVTTVFFLGLFVGKKNASYHAPAEDRVARIPVDDFTRYKRPAPIPPVVKEKTAPAEAPVVDASAARTAAAPVAAVPATPTAKVAAEPAAPAATTPASAVAASVPATPASTDKAAADAKAKEAAAKEQAAKEAAAAKEKAKAEPETGRGYTVQILATRKSADADALVKKLKSRGFAAYIKKMSDGEGAWYRVRVGSYGAFSEAKGMADKCRRDLGLGQAFVSTE